MRLTRDAAGVLVAIAFLVSGCGEDKPDAANTSGTGTASVVGTWNCPVGEDDSDVLVLSEDGAITITPQDPGRGSASEGTWTLDGSTLTVAIDGREDVVELEDGELPECTPSDAGDDASTSTTSDGGSEDASIAGTYSCTPTNRPPDMVPEEWELKEDGTIERTAGGDVSEGTWELDGNAGEVTYPEGTDPFTVDDDGRLVFGDGAFICTPAG